MDYNIKEARIEYESGKLKRITVLVEISQGDMRAIFATTTPRSGYMHIPDGAALADDLLQQVAGYGLQTVDRDDIFPNWKTKFESSL